MRRLLLLPALLLPLLVVPAASADGRLQAAPASSGVVLAAQAPDGVVLLDPATGARRRLVVPGGLDPAVSPDGTRLAFGLPEGTGCGYRCPVQLYASALDGTGRVRLTSGPARSGSPDWSPDGTRLALCRTAVAGGPASLAVVRADGTQGRPVPGTGRACAPSWSPDGSLLAYVGNGSVGVTDVEGRQRQQVLEASAVGAPDWAPDGRSLTVCLGGSESSVVRLDLASRRSRTITEFEGYHVTWERAVHAADGSLYTGIGTESFPDGTGSTTLGQYLEHRTADGTRLGGFEVRDGTSRPGPQVAGPLPRDGVVPAPVAATATAGPGRIDVDVAPSGAADAADAAGAVVRYAEGLLAPPTPDDGLPGGRVLPGRLSLPGLAPRTTYTVAVFPVDWSGETGPPTTVRATTPAEEPTALELHSSAGEVRHGAPVVLTAVLTRNGRPSAGAPVALYGHRSGQPDVLLQQLTTDDAGRVTARRVPSAHTRYTVRYAGQGDVLPSSDTGVVHVRTAVAATASRTRVARGGAVTLVVHVAPATPGGVVRLQQTVAGRTVASSSGRQDASGVVRLRVDTRTAGRQRLQVGATATEHYPGSAEAALQVG